MSVVGAISYVSSTDGSFTQAMQGMVGSVDDRSPTRIERHDRAEGSIWERLVHSRDMEFSGLGMGRRCLREAVCLRPTGCHGAVGQLARI